MFNPEYSNKVTHKGHGYRALKTKYTQLFPVFDHCINLGIRIICGFMKLKNYVLARIRKSNYYKTKPQKIALKEKKRKKNHSN